MLSRCGTIYGGTTVVDAMPRFDLFHDVLYVPTECGAAEQGCYDRSRKLITASAVFRGIPEIHPVHGQYVTALDPLDHPFAPAGPLYVFLGAVSTHYGHFLVATLSRLWFLRDKPVPPHLKLLYCDMLTPAQLFEHAFMRDMFGLLGLTEQNFVRFDRPMRLHQVGIPAPSFEENNIAHRAFAGFCNEIGNRIESRTPLVRQPRPAYLSKSNVTRGVSRLVNEDLFCKQLEACGIDIVFPETLSFPAQAMMFRERPVILGTIGSALHTGIFSPRNRLIGLSYGGEVWSNQILFDRANDNDALYLHPQHDLDHLGRDGHFHNNFQLRDPHRTADEFVRCVEAFLASRDLPALSGARATSPLPFPGKLLSRGRPTTQSSASAFGRAGTPEADSAGGVSGLLTGTFQFHTDIEPEPWWQVDLEAPEEVSGVRLFNRFDGVEARSARLRLLGSLDGENWDVLVVRDDPRPFGGIDGRPFEWRPAVPVRLRFLRVQLLGTDYLHLDQVQVFGPMRGAGEGRG